MMRRTPMKAGSGFKRKTFERKQAPPPAKATRKATYTGTTTGPVEKEEPVVCEAYRRLVRQLPCIRCNIVGYTQFCHTDLGKGMGLKTDDRLGWPGCGPHGDSNGCHHEVGRLLSREERRDFEVDASFRTRHVVTRMGLWPPGLEPWPGD